MPRNLLAYAEGVLGSCSTLREEARAGETHLLEVVDAEGERWFVKYVKHMGMWQAEVRAYRRWVPAIGDNAPALRAADAGRQTMVLSAVPGEQASPTDPDAHRQAGDLLCRFHHAVAPQPAPPGYMDWWQDRLERWISATPDTFSPAERDFARQQTKRLRELSPQRFGPCHGDYRPYNWLVDDSGMLRVIDFGSARRQAWCSDLTRLYLGPWWKRPDLAAAFLDGYGVDLSEEDRAFIEFSAAAQVVIHIGWARRYDVAQVESSSRRHLEQLMAGRPVVAAAR